MRIKGFVCLSGYGLKEKTELWNIEDSKVYNVIPSNRRYEREQIAFAWGIFKDKTRFAVVILEGYKSKPTCDKCKSDAATWAWRKRRWIYDDADLAKNCFNALVDTAKLLTRGLAKPKKKT